MSFANDIDRFLQKAVSTNRQLFKAVVTHVHNSVVVGSPVTGAPGQPIEEGDLINSWKLRFESDGSASTSSDLLYAPIIEDNRRGARLRSKVGGFHSVKLTRLGYHKIVAHELDKVKSGGGTVSKANVPRRRAMTRQRDTSGKFIGNRTRLEFDNG